MIDLTFIPVSRACPICNEWIDCVTHVHAEKHGMKRSEFKQLFERYQAPFDSTFMDVSPLRDHEPRVECILRNVLSGVGKFTLRYLSDKLGIRIGTIRSTFADVDRDLFDSEYRSIPVLGLHNGANASYRELVYQRKEVA